MSFGLILDWTLCMAFCLEGGVGQGDSKLCNVLQLLYNTYAKMLPLCSADSAEKSNIWQMKKKERKQFRRQQDENYALVHDINKIYETLRRFVIQPQSSLP